VGGNVGSDWLYSAVYGYSCDGDGGGNADVVVWSTVMLVVRAMTATVLRRAGCSGGNGWRQWCLQWWQW